MVLYSAKPILSEIVLGRLVYTIAGGTGIGVCGFVRWEASGLYGAIDDVKDDVKDDVQGEKDDIQGVKDGIQGLMKV